MSETSETINQILSETEIEEGVSRSHLFFSLDPDIIKAIASVCTTEHFHPNEIIFYEGDPGDCFYVIIEGHVQIIRKEADQELVLAIMDPNEGFGELALLINQPRTATAKAADEVKMIKLKRRDLEDLIRKYPQLLVQLNKLMNERVSLLEGPDAEQTIMQKHKFSSEYRIELDPALLDLLFQLNDVAGGQEQVKHCKEAAMLAREMSKMLCPMVHEQLFYAGCLHEIGKISIPQDLVIRERKGEPLTEEEALRFSEIFRNAVNILKPDKKLSESVKFIEFLDRESYLEMPVESQILLTADDYLMKVSNNYAGVNASDALAMMKEKSGTRYNPKVIAALEKTVQKFTSLNVEKQLIFIKQMNIALDYKDHYTLSHSLHTSEMSEKIGSCIGLSKRELEILQYGCELHDVGKIYIPTNLLVAQRKLTEEEMTIMKKHPVYSAQFFLDIPGMDELTDIIKHHHERYDGTGYPEGLKGDEIPLFSRIMMIADVYSALTTKRPYRLDEKGEKIAFSPRMALAIMEGMQGHFDPQLFEVFKKIILEEGKECEEK